MVVDLFEHTILCSECNKKMQRGFINKNGFQIRAVMCTKCGEKILHPSDLSAAEEFASLRKKDFRVKLRLVGNSYAVSIPREIVDFMHMADKQMDEMVDLCFEEMGRISLNF
ncbi:hypothetical protein CMI41_03455 [Candidatus Pacearchaeota archaeon]|jgi:DNA-directed RNA polymerase subunit RPC12/RpoP|nr:hypothetical protein [Candidatus Pacearchaeota archaeon]|tara:strand:+ start:6676 stop:7011 length:336 start_codon:yes stop_codon:yes gene_type:complete